MESGLKRKEEMLCLMGKMKKSLELPKSDLEGKYRSSYQGLRENTVSSVNACLQDALYGGFLVPEGAMVRCREDILYREAQEDVRRALRLLSQLIWAGDAGGVTELFRFFRQMVREIVIRHGGVEIDAEGSVWS